MWCERRWRECCTSCTSWQPTWVAPRGLLRCPGRAGRYAPACSAVRRAATLHMAVHTSLCSPCLISSVLFIPHHCPISQLGPQAAECLASGLLVPRDEAAAFGWWQRASDMGSAAASIKVGLRYFRGDPPVGE